MVDEEGFVKGYEVYEGSTTDITTLKGTIETRSGGKLKVVMKERESTMEAIC